jgi:tRNA G18 (ribose-2'-O)-methylase SpoU
MRSNVNLSRIVRAAGCCGIRRVVCCGTARLVDKIARDAETDVQLERHRTLPPVLRRFGEEGFPLIGLEQTDRSVSIFEYRFPRRAVLVVGNERLGIEPDVLALLDETIEIPVHGRPDSHNAATATCMALYEYCRQYPRG